MQVLQVSQEIWKFVLCPTRLEKFKKLPTILPGEALKGTKGVNMYLDQRYYEPKDAFGREVFSAGLMFIPPLGFTKIADLKIGMKNLVMKNQDMKNLGM